MRKLNNHVARHNTKNKCNNKSNNKSNKHKYYNNITKKNITKKYMIGGASGSNISAIRNVGIPGPTLKTLIESKDVTHVIIQYRGIKFKCKLGGNMCIIGSIKPSGCIEVYYNFIYNCANINSFFYSKSKVECIGLNKAINNTNFINNVNINNKTTRQKKLNKLFLTLIDIININLKIKMCGVEDAASIMIGQNSIRLLYKHMERGYGFYNEFGYLYIPDGYEDWRTSLVLYNNIEIDKRVTYANEFLEYLNTFSTQNITKVTEIYTTSVNNNSLLETLSIYNTDNMSKIRDEYPKNDNEKSKYLLQSLLDSKEYKESKTFREYITLVIKSLQKLQQDKSQTISLLHIKDIILKFFMDKNIQKLDYIKYYKYDDDNIFTTELNTKHDKQANNKANNKEIKYTLPYKFVLQEHEKQTITITKKISEENIGDNIIFDITIVPH